MVRTRIWLRDEAHGPGVPCNATAAAADDIAAADSPASPHGSEAPQQHIVAQASQQAAAPESARCRALHSAKRTALGDSSRPPSRRNSQGGHCSLLHWWLGGTEQHAVAGLRLRRGTCPACLCLPRGVLPGVRGLAWGRQRSGARAPCAALKLRGCWRGRGDVAELDASRLMNAQGGGVSWETAWGAGCRGCCSIAIGSPTPRRSTVRFRVKLRGVHRCAAP